MRATRLAPSPTGALHLGNLRTFALTWLAARAAGARLLMRVEDIDGPRKKPGAITQALQDLGWLGLDHDGEVVLQSHRLPEHLCAYDALMARGDLYACSCSRRDVEQAQGAPHAEEEMHYPGTCRGRYPDPAAAFAASGRPVALRFRVPSTDLAFEDEVHGAVRMDLRHHGGDFVVGRWDPACGFLPGYQLAVVVDDAAMGIDWVIRGDDLLASTPRQLLIARALDLPEPHYAHLPLVIGPDGRRLAKRHGDTRIASYRQAGLPSTRLLEWVASVSGVDVDAFRDPRSSGFSWEQLPRDRVIVPPHAIVDGPPLSGD
jgi:glutamyl-tRNA synthetase